jgi:trans-2,3-dihydro-3-hydroxyanthranilate isomerase
MPPDRMHPDRMHPYEILDVFTDTPLEGNQVAVFTAAAEIDEAVMQRTARELNLSETVFLLPGDAYADARARIFTPAMELPFAGHPILGSAFVVGARGSADTVRLRTGSGVVPVALERRDGRIVFGEMEQPLPTWEPFARRDELLAALGVERPVLPVEVYTNGPSFVMVALPDQPAVSALAPDLGALAKLGAVGACCFAGLEGRYWMRMFAPGMGVAEDPATGSAAGPMALHLLRHGSTAPGERIQIDQGVEIGRRSLLRARVEGAGDRVERIVVGGSAVPVASGRYRLA